MLSQHTQFMNHVSADHEAVHLLQYTTSVVSKDMFATHLENLATKFKITSRGSDLFRMFLSWCHTAKPLPINLKAVMQAPTIPIISIKALKTPFSPIGHHIAISPSIVKKWHHYLAFGKQADKRKRHWPIHLLNSSKLIADIAPTDSAILKNKKGNIISMVIRNFCPDKSAVAWADSIAKRAISI
ncbi:hypothetical protein Hypma_014787 [Hypsizygus marmoreus]|uniref:Uncharacterized protein n=1 Tax=Hypsizygus marmoreus TaxID=39966 RepID=A0A369JGQ9_HYPMA|nr:hypothetical protein Hypma_014787 [Hypsizygus marmoreus]